MNKILEMKKLVPGGSCPVMVAKIPRQIRREIGEFVKDGRKWKDHPLSDLKAHENYGYLDNPDGKKCNSYQCSVSRKLVEDSLWLPWTLRLVEKYFGKGEKHRQFKLREWEGHFDGYDMWTNFSYKGDHNPPHNHAGAVSGVIYYKNHGHPTVIDMFERRTPRDHERCEYEGKDGTMILFPSYVLHHVEEQTLNRERITLAFNIVRIVDDCKPAQQKIQNMVMDHFYEFSDQIRDKIKAIEEKVGINPDK